MSRITGKNSRLYMAVTSGGIATPAVFLKSWDHNAEFETVDVTAYEDTNKTYLSTVPDASGTYSGFLDTATAQTYTAAVDGIERKFYFYPDTTDTTKYTYGSALFTWSAQYPKDGAAEISGKWNATTAITKVG